jgi:hypothetical protein
MRVLISDHLKYIYHMNPKVASNTTLTVLYHLAGMAEEDISNPHRVSRDAALLQRYGLKAVDVAHDECVAFFATMPGYYTFSFTRNPFARLKSAYNDKLKRYAEIAFPDKLKQLENAQGVEKTKRYFQSALKREISFEQFARDICTRHLYGDQHWVPQYDRLRPDLCNYDSLGKIETYLDDLKKILQALGVDAADFPPFPAPLNSAPDPRSVEDYYTPALIRLVQQAYRRDFEEFGYDPSTLL